MDNLEFETLTSNEFTGYMREHKEKNYLVIDVRQASEYEEGHIPYFCPSPRRKKPTCAP